MRFATGRGRKAHMVSERSTLLKAACGAKLDKLIDKRFIDQSEFCGNCKKTREYMTQSQ